MKRLAIALLLIAAGTARAADGTCDRACLTGMITQYLDALVAHDPSRLPLAANVRFTEDSVERKLGEGLWKDASAVRKYRLDIIDVTGQTAASQVMVEASGAPVMLVLRLKVASGKISEIETLAVRREQAGRLFNADSLTATSKAMNVVPAAGQRNSRADLIRLAEFYPAGLKIGDFVAVDAPFASDAYRIENGFPTAGGACTRDGCKNIKTQSIIKHPEITYQVKAVDEQMGIVLLWMNFGDTNSYGPGNALIVWEAFKVYGGQIHAVEAFMKAMPKATQSGWK